MVILEFYDEKTNILWEIKKQDYGFSLWKNGEWKGTWMEISDIFECAVDKFDND